MNSNPISLKTVKVANEFLKKQYLYCECGNRATSHISVKSLDTKDSIVGTLVCKYCKEAIRKKKNNDH